MITGQSLSESNYEGWVAWLEGGTPIFEHVPFQPELSPLIKGGRALPYRPAGPNCMDWKHVPHEKIERLELYFFRSEPFWRPHRQPIVMIQRTTPYPLRWVQMKMAGVQAPVGDGQGQRRTGISGYKVGYFDPQRMETHLVEVVPNGSRHLVLAGQHPCEPIPSGWGLAPSVLGLNEDWRPV